jgi:hypothetical protein
MNQKPQLIISIQAELGKFSCLLNNSFSAHLADLLPSDSSQHDYGLSSHLQIKDAEDMNRYFYTGSEKNMKLNLMPKVDK